MLFSLFNVTYANTEVTKDTQTILFESQFEGDKNIVFAENFESPVNEMWDKAGKKEVTSAVENGEPVTTTIDKFELKTENGLEHGGTYGRIATDVIYNVYTSSPVSTGKFVMEFDYRSNNAGDKCIYIDNSRGVEFERMYFQKNDAVELRSKGSVSGIAADEWHHVKWCIDFDNSTQIFFVDDKASDEFYFTTGDKDVDFRRVIIRSNGTNEYWDFDNIEFYLIDEATPYAVNSINYSTNKEYPTANAVINSVNVTKLKDKDINTSLMVAVYDNNGIMQSLTKQTINSSDFGVEAKDIVLEKPITLPNNFDSDWNIGAFVWDSQNLIPLAFKYENEYNIKLSGPVSREIFQRDANDIGKVKIQGVINAENVVSVEVNAVKAEDATKGKSVDWTSIEYNASEKTFNATLDVPAGGWYTINVRASLADGGVVTDSVEKVGVGEIFVMSGQSNSTNYGGENPDRNTVFKLTRAEYDTISMYDIRDGEWALAKDPLFNPNNADKYAITNTTPWPTMANELTEYIDVPVGIVSLGQGGRRIDQFMPGTTLYNQLATAVTKFGPDGIRAILFHQGEQDSDSLTTKEAYQSTFENIIASLRQEAGWTIPWIIANVGYHTTENAKVHAPVIRAAQQAICEADPDCYLGPDTDLLGGMGIEGVDAKEKDENGNYYRQNDGTNVHFSYSGVVIHGKLWTKSIMKVFFKDLLPDEPEPPEVPEEPEETVCFYSGFEDGDPAELANPDSSGRNFTVSTSKVTSNDSDTGNNVYEFTGITNTTQSWMYNKVFDLTNTTVCPEPIVVEPGIYLEYWMKVTDEASKNFNIDMTFESGSALRDRGASDTNGVNMHPVRHANSVKEIGQWQKFRCNIGDIASLNGLKISTVMFAYDQGSNAELGLHSAFLDNVYIGNAKINTRPLMQLIAKAEAIDTTGFADVKVAELNKALTYAKQVAKDITEETMDEAVVGLMNVLETFAQPVIIENEYEGDKAILNAEYFEGENGSIWSNLANRNFTLQTEEGREDKYGHISNLGDANDTFVIPPPSSGRFVIEFDYRGSASGNMLVNLETRKNNITFGNIEIKNGFVTTRVGHVVSITPDEWHHIKLGINLDTNTQTLFVDGESASAKTFIRDPDLDIRVVKMREYTNNNTEVYWDLDNVEFYMVDNSQPYTINSINYSTNSTYPTANAVAQSVNITKTKERLANASLVAELYDANGELKATSTQPISNTDFETNVATDIALTTQITLPDDFAWDWKIVTYIWDNENEDVLSEMYESKYNIDLQNLVSRQIFQRNANDIGKVKLQGVINADDVVTVEASAEKTEGTQKGSDVDWTPIAYDALTNTFNATLDVPAGGWYTIKVRA